jgi:hypothetical protein
VRPDGYIGAIVDASNLGALDSYLKSVGINGFR